MNIPTPEEVREFRARHRLSQAEACDIMGIIYRQWLVEVEHGRAPMPEGLWKRLQDGVARRKAQEAAA